MDSNSVNDMNELTGVQKNIYDILSRSNEVYNYESIGQLKFELNLRKSIIEAAKELDHSRLSFKVFRKSKCNNDFWHRTEEGGFKLESGVKPSDAIKDIYLHGSQYGTECSTAMVIVYYKALVDILPEELFNSLFPDIYLMNWQHLDSDLGIVDHIRVTDYLPGDGRYFKNPDVDPITPEWQGENVFDLGNGLYYGHGLGILDADRIINALNERRLPDSTTTAYLLDSAKRPGFKRLADKYTNFASESQSVDTSPEAPSA